MCVLDSLPNEVGNKEHSNVIPVLPVQSRDPPTGRTSRRRRREALRSASQRLSGQRSSGGNAVMRDYYDVSTSAEPGTVAAADIAVSHYVTG